MRLFTCEGWLDIESIRKYMDDHKITFTFIWGGRGIGKTYGVLKYYVQNNRKFILLRRTQTQIDLIANENYSPFKPINADLGVDIHPKTITKNQYGFYTGSGENEKLTGYGMAVSTISNIRGFSGEDVTDMLYDEFIPERHERPIKFEAEAFLNGYETINRNRELKGLDPVRVIGCSNSNDLANAIFIELGLVNVAMKMTEKHIPVHTDAARGIMLINVEKSPISNKKKKTALYKLVGEKSDFAKMSIENSFAKEEIGRIASRKLQEYNPLVTVGEITIYKHKSGREYYISEHRRGSCPQYGTGEVELRRFNKIFYWIWEAYLDNKIIFESYLTQRLFERYTK